MPTYSPYDDLKWYISRTCDAGACVKVARKDGLVVIGNTNSPRWPVQRIHSRGMAPISQRRQTGRF